MKYRFWLFNCFRAKIYRYKDEKGVSGSDNKERLGEFDE